MVEMDRNEILEIIFEIIIGVLGIILIIIGVIATTVNEIALSVTWPLYLAGGVFIILSILTILHGFKYRSNKKNRSNNRKQESIKQQKDNST